MNIDTLSIAKGLRATELPSEQVEAIAAAIGRSVNEGSATRDDLNLLKFQLTGGIERLRTEIENTKNQIMTWVIGSVLTVGGTIIAVIKL